MEETNTEAVNELTPEAKHRADEIRRCEEIARAVALRIANAVVEEVGWAWRIIVPDRGHCDIRRDLMWAYYSPERGNTKSSVHLFEGFQSLPSHVIENVVFNLIDSRPLPQ